MIMKERIVVQAPIRAEALLSRDKYRLPTWLVANWRVGLQVYDSVNRILET